jgi:hypothetical protein
MEQGLLHFTDQDPSVLLLSIEVCPVLAVARSQARLPGGNGSTDMTQDEASKVKDWGCPIHGHEHHSRSTVSTVKFTAGAHLVRVTRMYRCEVPGCNWTQFVDGEFEPVTVPKPLPKRKVRSR